MLPQHLAALVLELARPEYDGLGAEEAYRLLSERPLARLRFVTQSQLEAVPVKQRAGQMFFLVDEPIEAGFPNRVRRHEFNAAWSVARETDNRE